MRPAGYERAPSNHRRRAGPTLPLRMGSDGFCARQRCSHQRAGAGTISFENAPGIRWKYGLLVSRRATVPPRKGERPDE